MREGGAESGKRHYTHLDRVDASRLCKGLNDATPLRRLQQVEGFPQARACLEQKSHLLEVEVGFTEVFRGGA